MATVRQTVIINAPIDKVFELVSDVTAFRGYSRHIKKIEDLGDRHYRWHIVIMSVPLSWEAEVYEFEPPTIFSWKSLSGFSNNGRYRLKALDENTTEVTFRMYYSFGTVLPLRIAAHILAPLFEKGVAEFLNSIEKKLGA